jgi:hypothetical protein
MNCIVPCSGCGILEPLCTAGTERRSDQPASNYNTDIVRSNCRYVSCTAYAQAAYGAAVTAPADPVLQSQQ